MVFSLIALPLSTQSTRVLRSHGFATSLGIIFAYYLLLTVGETLGRKGVLPAALSLWLPNIILGGVGILLFQGAARETQIFPTFSWWSRTRIIPSSLAQITK